MYGSSAGIDFTVQKLCLVSYWRNEFDFTVEGTRMISKTIDFDLFRRCRLKFILSRELIFI